MASRETARETGLVEITPEVLLKAYACGIFPMAENADDPSLYWIEPEQRGVIPLEAFHLPRRLARTVRTDRYKVYIDRDFAAVLDGCAAPGKGRARTWINARIRSLYTRLHEIGHCHSSRSMTATRLVGGLYGVRLGRAFFGESMFHLERDASKVALVHLVGAAARRRLYAARHAIRDRSPEIASARSKSRGGTITSCSRAAIADDADFGALPLDRSGAAAQRF